MSLVIAIPQAHHLVGDLKQLIRFQRLDVGIAKDHTEPAVVALGLSRRTAGNWRFIT